MAWAPSPTSARQTATNGAATLVAAGLTLEDVKDNLEEIRDFIFADLQEFIKAEAAQNNSGGGNRGGGQRSGGGNTAPGETVFNKGKFAGKTIAAVADEAPDYLDWYVNNAKNEFMVKKIEAYLDERRA